MGIRLGSALAALVATISAAGAIGVDEPEQARRFEDSLVVRELEVFFDDSVLPPLESLAKRGDADFTVLEDGRPLERIESVGTGGDGRPREVVAWFDPALAAPAALAAAARALADAAGEIPFDDGVTIIEVDPRPAERLHTRRPETLALGLHELARRWDSSPRSAPGLEARLRAIDRLSCWIGARGDGGPRAILIAGDGWRVDAALLNELGELSRTDEPGDLRLAALAAGDLASADGLPLVLRRETAGEGTRLCLPDGAARGPLRWLTRRDGEAGTLLGLVDAPAESETPGCVPLGDLEPAASNLPSWWLLENLETGEWGALAAPLGDT